MNDIKVYAKELRDEVYYILGSDYAIEIKEVTKNNSVKLYGLMITKDNTDISPIVYFGQFFEQNMPIQLAAQEVVDSYHNNVFNLDLNIGQSLTSFETIRKKIFVKLINAETNSDLLERVPHRMILGDLAIIYYIIVPIMDSIGNVTVTKELMDTWGIDENYIYSLALANSQETFMPRVSLISDIIQELNPEFYIPCEFDMYVCNLNGTEYGASVILFEDFLKTVSESLDSDLYILPSSICEVIIMRAHSDYKAKDLREMVNSVNATVLEPELYLSGNVYYYDSDENTLCIS